MVIDFNLDTWATSLEGPLATVPLNGFALAGVLRAHAGVEGLKSSRATAFVLRSGFLSELSPGLPSEAREHVIARLNNLEWVFQKGNLPAGATPAEVQLPSLARAVVALSEKWPRGRPEREQTAVHRLLALPDRAAWAGNAREEVQACHPPAHELSSNSRGLPFLRWFLHRVLPYPCFLWDSQRIAMRLRLTLDEFIKLRRRKNNLIGQLARAAYRGILSDFLGDRWWAAGIELALWNLTKGDPRDSKKLRRLAGYSDQPPWTDTTDSDIVACLDADLRVLPDPAPSSMAVRIQPDDWPPYADQAWTTLTLAKETPHLRALVLRQDAERLSSVGGK